MELRKKYHKDEVYDVHVHIILLIYLARNSGMLTLFEHIILLSTLVNIIS